MKAHVLSLVLEPDKLDEKKLVAAYAALDWNAPAAIKNTSLANDLLERRDRAAAVAGFHEALALCPHIPAARNGLPWALLEPKDAKPQDLAEALREAKAAVEQTEELDFAALDTLAAAHERNGEAGLAREATRKAMKLKPDHPDLLRRMKAPEGTE